MNIRKTFLKVFPYLSSISAGVIFYLLGTQSKDFKDLFVNISAAFIAIPFIYLFYKIVEKYSKKKLNKEIIDYAKMQIDREILSLINQLSKIVYPIEERDFTLRGINKFLTLKRDDLKKIISKREYIGFQVLKKWLVIEDNLHEILKNPYILDKLEDEQVIAIIQLLKSIRYLEQLQKIKDLYVDTGEKTSSFKIVNGKDLNEENAKFSDRYLLLKDLGNNKFLVADFGDFPRYNIDKLLRIFKINSKYIDIYIDAISDMITEINNWVDLTGGEFLIDTKMFRLGVHSINNRISNGGDLNVPKEV
jgi:hypothetical protein